MEAFPSMCQGKYALSPHTMVFCDRWGWLDVRCREIRWAKYGSRALDRCKLGGKVGKSWPGRLGVRELDWVLCTLYTLFHFVSHDNSLKWVL